MPGLTVTIITLNEAANIRDAIESVSFADEIIVVDSHSHDETTAIARRYTDRVITREWPGYVAQKNFAASQASNDWILSVDADERVTVELAKQIQAVLASDPPCAGYRVPRASHYLGRWIRSTDWYPDFQLRLYDRRRASWHGQYVHESVKVSDGAVQDLRGDLLHYPYRDVSHHLTTIDRYTTLSAKQMYEAGRRTGLWQLALHPPAAFLRNYLLRGGIRDGSAGFVVSRLNAYYVFLKFVKLWDLQRAGGRSRT